MLPDTVLPFAGALLPLHAPTPPAVIPAAWQSRLAIILNTPADMQTLTPLGDVHAAVPDPLLAPPIYGATHAGVRRCLPRR